MARTTFVWHRVTRVGVPVMQIPLAIELTSEAPRKKYLTPDRRWEG